jgi:predicted transposase YdaD
MWSVKKVVNPHDKFFKDVFSKKETAVDFLANFLPEDVLQLLDLGTAEIGRIPLSTRISRNFSPTCSTR